MQHRVPITRPRIDGPEARALLNALPFEAIVVDGEGTIVAANAAWTRASADSGRCGGGDCVGLRYADVCRAAGATILGGRDDALAQILSGERLTASLTHRCGPGDPPRYYDVRMSLLDVGGGPHVLVLHEDSTLATKAKIEQTDLLACSRWLELAASATDNAVVVTDAQGVVLWVNAASSTLTGLAPHELIGRAADEVLCGPDPDALDRLRLRGAIRRGEPVIAEVLTHTALGGPFWLAINCQPVRDEFGSLTNFAIVGSDVTERRRGDEALRASEERFRLLVQSAPAPICVTQDGRFVYTNHAACALFGAADPGALVGRAVLETAPPEERAEVGERERRALESATPRPVVEEQRCRLDGKPLDVVIARSPCTHEGRPAVQCVIHDLSLLRLLEDELRHAQKMDLIGQFASGLAHDFNNLLTAIFGHAAIARSRLAPGHGALEPLAMIDEAAQQAASITKSLLTFGRKTFTHKQPVDLVRLVRDLAEMVAPLLPASIRLKVRDPERSPAWAHADANQVQQVLMNLAINARDAMPAGGDLDLTVRYRPAGEDGAPARVGVCVSDNGQGMTPQVQARIFEPFFSTKPRGQGTGLGLSMVHGLVEAHGGTVSVSSAPGKGSAFTVWLSEIGPPLDDLSGQPRRGAGERVLVVAGHRHVRGILSASLQTLGFRPEVADTDSAGGIPAPSTDTRAVIVDVDGLPEGGHATIAALVATCPVIVLHGGSAAPSGTGARTVAIRKPVHMADLAARLAMLLHGGASNGPAAPKAPAQENTS